MDTLAASGIEPVLLLHNSLSEHWDDLHVDSFQLLGVETQFLFAFIIVVETHFSKA